MKYKEVPSQEYLRQLFTYKCGKLIWRKTGKGRSTINLEAGHRHYRGNSIVNIDRQNYQLHRLIFQMLKGGVTTDKVIDHIDNNPANNDISNLRLVSQSINMRNQKQPSKRNTSGVTGVAYHSRSKKWRAIYTDYSGKVHEEYHNTFEQAVHARSEAQRKYGYKTTATFSTSKLTPTTELSTKETPQHATGTRDGKVTSNHNGSSPRVHRRSLV